MSVTHLLATHLGLTRRPASRRKTPVARPHFRPMLEALEDRCLPSTLTVTTTADSGTGSLRAEIGAAKNGDSIVFAPSLDGQTITLTSGELLISKNITIAGSSDRSVTVSGDKLSRVFELSSKTKPQVSISGLTLDNGVGVYAAGSSHYFDGTGGAILNWGTLTVSNCMLSGNTAGRATNSNAGGAIENQGALTVTGSTLSGNSALNGGDGGGIDNFGTVTVSGSTLSGNSAGFGGGIYNAYTGTSTTTATVNNSILSDNNALDGGGIYNWGTLTISGSTLSGNSANHGGAIVDDNHGTLTLSGSTVTGNTAVYSGGGIVISTYATVTVENGSSITGNTAPTGYGADVYNLGTLSWDGTGSLGVLDGNPAKRI